MMTMVACPTIALRIIASNPASLAQLFKETGGKTFPPVRENAAMLVKNAGIGY